MEQLKQTDLSFSPLSPLPNRCYHHCPKPLVHPKHKDSIIITTDFEEPYGGIYLYDLVNNKAKLLDKYEDFFFPEKYEQFIDEKENNLCIFGGVHDSFVCIDLDSMDPTYIEFDGWNKVCKTDKYPNIFILMNQ